jgi:hypothetical protein
MLHLYTFLFRIGEEGHLTSGAINGADLPLFGSAGRMNKITQ